GRRAHHDHPRPERRRSCAPPLPLGCGCARADIRRARGRGARVRFFTGFAGAVIEAWTELRIHRTRVLLSLVGVGIAIAALTLVAALGGMVQQSQTETFERQSGRPAMLNVSVYNASTGTAPDPDAVQAAFQAATERYRIDHTSRLAHNNWLVQLP